MKKVVLGLMMALSFFACKKEANTDSGSGQGGGSVVPVYGKADILDLMFSSDATGLDASSMHNPVTTNGSFVLSTWFDAKYGRYIPHFGGNAESVVGTGYYRIDYHENIPFLTAIQKGFTLETVFCIDALPSTSGDGVGVVSSLEEAGFGLWVDGNGNLCFEIFASNQKLLKSGKNTVKAGTFHHAVANYEPGTSKISLYLDGELKATVDADGPLTLSTVKARRWLCVGGDCSTALNYAQRTFKGDIPFVRMYSLPLTARTIAEHTLTFKHDPETPIAVSELAYLTPCQVASGCKYYIYGTGFKNGDAIVLSNNRGQTVCTTTVGSGYAIATIPSSLVSGTYSLGVRRGETTKMLGSTVLTVASEPGAGAKTRVFAHRCVHNNTSGPYENTLEAFKATMNAGILGAEFDVWITTDGQVVVHHDGTMGGYVFESSTWSQLKNLKMPTGEHLPLLSEFLDEGKKNSKFICNFEIKVHTDNQRNRACADAVAELISARGMTAQCRLMSYSEVALDRLHEKLPTLKLDFLGTKDPNELKTKSYNGISYNMNLLSAHPDWIDTMHKMGWEVTTWTPATAPEMMTFINLGVDYITVDQTAIAKQVTERTYVSR
ncbi:MAG: hypothetical protein IJR34_04605 [Bacteroidales bacterium]|nr:hypothetical protein [Bacteroidales bacterium]MBQ9597513.1 hypothetical protein [Bacteroidales bacterium]